ncbi:MAG TPA: hypothetical protein VGQ58_11420 [Candidatus Limnocylindrales bacterium]|jgi:hypothetical protein|nr:hypothetical protein [Candidatus Limnocylindrales bacterium]
MLVRAGASAALVASLLLGSAAPALASCVMPPPIEEAVRDADLAFVGTVTSVANLDRWATVAVAEVWVGPDLPPVVEVRGGPGPGAMSSVDRMFAARTTYLFIVGISDGTLSDNACSSTTEWSDELAALRPANARPPLSPSPESGAADPFDPASLLLPVALIAGGGLIVFGAALMIRRST